MAEAEDQDSKTEEASQRKIDEALEKGNVPFSREAPTFAVLVGMLAITSFLLRDAGAKLVGGLERYIENPAGWALEGQEDAMRLLSGAVAEAGLFLLVPVAILMAAGLVAAGLQNLPRMVLNRIMPDFSRISPSKGWKRTFGLQGQIEFLKACAKFLGISTIAFFAIMADRSQLLDSMIVEPGDFPDMLRRMAIRLLASACVASLVLMAADLIWSRISWRRNLRMSRQELKDEHKQTDGDPLVKAKQRSLSRDRQRRRMMAQVPRATVVIANPTHYAVALYYVREKGGAPLVLAKGKDLIALKIRQIAEESGIPVVEDKPLARALCDSVEIDQMIPAEFYQAVAQIIYFISTRKVHYRSAH